MYKDIRNTNSRLVSDTDGNLYIKQERYPYESKVGVSESGVSNSFMVRREYIGPVAVQESKVNIGKNGEISLERIEKPGEIENLKTSVNINKDSSIEISRYEKGNKLNNMKLDSNGEFKFSSKDNNVVIESRNGDLIISVRGDVRFEKIM